MRRTWIGLVAMVAFSLLWIGPHIPAAPAAGGALRGLPHLPVWLAPVGLVASLVWLRRSRD